MPVMTLGYHVFLRRRGKFRQIAAIGDGSFHPLHEEFSQLTESQPLIHFNSQGSG